MAAGPTTNTDSATSDTSADPTTEVVQAIIERATPEQSGAMADITRRLKDQVQPITQPVAVPARDASTEGQPGS